MTHITSDMLFQFLVKSGKKPSEIVWKLYMVKGFKSAEGDPREGAPETIVHREYVPVTDKFYIGILERLRAPV